MNNLHGNVFNHVFNHAPNYTFNHAPTGRLNSATANIMKLRHCGIEIKTENYVEEGTYILYPNRIRH